MRFLARSQHTDDRMAALAMNVVLHFRPRPIVISWCPIRRRVLAHHGILSPSQHSSLNERRVVDFLPSLLMAHSQYPLGLRCPPSLRYCLKLVWSIGQFWVGVLPNVTIGRILTNRSLPSDAASRSRTSTVLIAIAFNQVTVVRKRSSLLYCIR